MVRLTIGAIIALLTLFTTGLFAQGTVVTDRVRLNAGPCVITSQAGPPIQFVLSGACAGITTSAATNLTLSPTGDLIVDPSGNDILPNLNYDINLGMLSKKYLTLHAAELWVETLVAQNTMATIGGRVLVAPTNILEVDLAAATTTISVKYNNLTVGDIVYLESNGKLEFMSIASGPTGGGPFSYGVVRNLDGSGANEWFGGDAVLNTGAIGDGFLDLYSTSGVLASGSGPTIVGNVRTGTAYNAYAPRWAIGNLNGLYSYGLDTYGAAFGNASATNVTIDATNGFRIRSGTTNRLQADTAGNLSMTGNLTIGTEGVIRSGATAFDVGVGWWMDFNGGTPRMRIGDPNGNRMTWNGTTLTLVGEGGGITNISGGNIQTNSITATQIAANSINSGHIIAGTIVASDIAAGSITADRLNVTTLSAITANLGTVTAGSISGVTISAGGTVTLNSSGITVAVGTNSTNYYKFDNNRGMMYSTSSDAIVILGGSGGVALGGGGGGVTQINGSRVAPNVNGTVELGQSGGRWEGFWLEDFFQWANPPTTTSADYPMVYSTGNTQVYRKTNGINGNTVCGAGGFNSIDFHRGIAVSHTCN